MPRKKREKPALEANARDKYNRAFLWVYENFDAAIEDAPDAFTAGLLESAQSDQNKYLKEATAFLKNIQKEESDARKIAESDRGTMAAIRKLHEIYSREYKDQRKCSSCGQDTDAVSRLRESSEIADMEPEVAEVDSGSS